MVSLSGLDMTLGFEWMQEEIEGNLMFGLLLALPLVGLCATFVNEKKVEIAKRYETFKVRSYTSAICAGATVLLILYATSALSSGAEGSALEITACAALNIMEFVSLISAIVGGYLAYLVESRKKNDKVLSKGFIIAKCCGKIFGGSLICLIIIMVPFSQSLRPSTIADEYTEKSSSVSQEGVKEGNRDFSKVDLGEYIGKPEKELSELGFEYDADLAEYSALDGNVYVSCDEEGKINTVMIEAADGNEPSLYGVKIGMTKTQVSEKLKNDFSMADESDGGLTFADTATGGAVLCQMDGEVVTTLSYMVFSEEELQELLDASSDETNYLFPDSDKRYFTEDEVRGLGADMLKLGRNEIFARHGYIFKDDSLKEYFGSRAWYDGTVPGEQFNADAAFNDFEKKNLELIKKIEDEVNGAQGNFIGRSGVYISVNPPIDGMTGQIEILSVGKDTISFTVGLLEVTGSLMSGKAQITSENTAQAIIDGFTISFSWSDAENMYVTNVGETDSREAEGIRAVTDSQSYIRPLEFN